MRRQRAKRPPVPEVSSYRGRGFRQIAPWLAAAPALPGLMLILIRPLGMRFSGFLLVALAAVLLVLTNWVKPTKKLHPIVFIVLSAVVGVAFHFAGV